MKLKNKNLFQEKAFINGKWLDCKNKLEVFNPSNGELIGTIPNFDAIKTKLAISEAKNSLKEWQNLTAKNRSEILRKWYNLIIENLEDLAIILTTEQGKPLKEARGEILYGASFVEYYAEEAKRIKGENLTASKQNQKIITEIEPIGVVGAITPWNFPSAMITRKVAPAIACGCAVVLKPSELTPFSALALAYLAKEAGIFDGVFSVITGDASEIGKEICENFDVRKLSFTGSTKVGKMLNELCAKDLKKVSLELGGSAPFIVCKDANLDNAIKGLMHAKFRNGGQACTCVNRILLAKEIHDEFVEKLVLQVKKLKVGDGFEESCNIGPMINKNAKRKVKTLIDDAIKNGAKVEVGNLEDKGLFFSPTILTEVKTNMEIANQEIFGAVGAIQKFDSIDEAIEIANNTKYGLGSYIYSENQSTIFKIAKALEFGMVAVNGDSFATELAPFGGIKHSGFGKEGSHLGIYEFCQIKTLHISY